MDFPTIEDFIGNTPLVRLQRLPGETANRVLVKLEGNNPAGSVKDRPALSMIRRRGAQRDSPRRYPDRGHQRQYRHRPGDGGGDPRLQDGVGDA